MDLRKVFTCLAVLVCFSSMAGIFLTMRGEMPSHLLLAVLSVGFIGGGILAIWLGDRKFPNRLIILAILSGYLTFLFLGFSRVAQPKDRGGFLWLGLLTTLTTLVFAYDGLKEHEKK